MVIFLQFCLFIIAIAIRGRFLFGTHLKVNKDYPDRLEYIRKHKGNIGARHIGIINHHGIPFIVKPERWYHKLLKNMGIASEIQIKNKDFDQKYFITTDFPNHLERALSSGQLLKHLQELFALPVKSLHITSNKIWCIIKTDDLEKTNAYFTRHIEILESIANSSRKEAFASPMAGKPAYRGLIALIFICLHAGLITLGGLGIFSTYLDSIDMVDTSAWIIKSLLVGSVAVVAWFLLILGFLKNTSWVSWVLVDFFLCGIVGVMLSSVLIVRDVNVSLAQPPAQIYTQKVLLKSCTLKCKKRCGKNCTKSSAYPLQSAACEPSSRSAFMKEKKQTDYICGYRAWYEYSIQIEHWSKPISYSFEPNAELFDQTQEGGLLNVPVNQGALNLEWVDTDEIRLE